jgi:hypothetical protein
MWIIRVKSSFQRLVLAAAVSLTIGVTQAKSADCEVRDIAIVMPPGTGLTAVDSATPCGGAGLKLLVFRNEIRRRIVSVKVIVNYLDSDGKSIFSVPFFGTVDESEAAQEGLRPYVKSLLQKPVGPNEKFGLWGTNLESTRVAPARAEVTYVQITVDHGNGGFILASPSTEPLLFKLPNFFELELNSEKVPNDMWATLSIDERGRVEEVEIEPHSNDPDVQLGQVKSQLMQWSFFPGTQKFAAVKAKLALWIRFHERGFPLPAAVCPLILQPEHPRNFVEIDLKRTGDKRWEVLYGGATAKGTFNTVTSSLGPN